MARNRSLVRCFLLLDYLHEGHFDIYELAAEFKVHHRTIRRDLEALQEAYRPIVSNRGEYGRVLWHAER